MNTSFKLVASDYPPLISLDKAAELCATSRPTLYRWIGDGLIQTAKLGSPGQRGKRCVLTASLIEFVNSRIETTPAIKPLGSAAQALAAAH